MRIVLTGTHSTGKTSIVNRLAMHPDFEKYHISYSNTRDLGKRGFPINSIKGESYSTTQELVLTYHLKDLLRPNLLADRCLVDGLAYTQFLCDRRKVENATLELFGQLTSAFLHEYDFIFYSPIKEPAKDDGVRMMDESFRLGVDIILQKYLLPNIKHYTLPSTNVTENVEFILKVLKKSEVKVKKLK